ncbi:matrixin family metalloprotease [Lacunisphaera limnophila]|uniref:matrixin family metalloprotease n=1 Tax=Lacunisphaera limnophila TaxID=1838286 RepID=UPI0012FD6713|nr:matrixin family metalloprotease [Lacunisphaera limnophila]
MSAISNPLRRAALPLLLLSAVSAALAFTFTLNKTSPPPNGTGLPLKWPAGTIRLRLLLGDAATLADGSSYNQSARAAALTWNAVLGSAQFQTETATGNPVADNEVNELAFGSTIYGRDFGGTTLAVTTGYSTGNERIEADIIFNTRYSWDSYRGNARFNGNTLLPDIQRVALHELGHVLGLDHPDEAGQSVPAIMNSTIDNRDQLASDDTEGAQSLYGPPGAPANDNFSNAIVLRLGNTRTLAVKGYNTNATKETGEPSHADDGGTNPKPNPGGRSVWWRWTSPAAGGVTLDTRGSYFDSLLGVYTGTSLGSLTRIASSDDINPGVVQASTVTFNATAGTTYQIAVDGFNNDDGLGADNAGITLNLTFDGELGSAPGITTHPADATVTRGGSVSFSVTATGTAPLAYQWFFGDSPIDGATSATYSLSNVTASQAGAYRVTVSNATGLVTSNTATLTVNTPAPAPAPPGGGGGGGGAPSLAFIALLAALGITRFCLSRHSGPCR